MVRKTDGPMHVRRISGRCDVKGPERAGYQGKKDKENQQQEEYFRGMHWNAEVVRVPDLQAGTYTILLGCPICLQKGRREQKDWTLGCRLGALTRYNGPLSDPWFQGMFAIRG